LSIETITEIYRIIQKIDRDLNQRYNVAPTQDVPIVRLDQEGIRALTFARWGLIPG
jgi:putative SOS response-associated peptidase YedK